MSAPESFVTGSEKLTRVFGHWPSFHDAEVIELHLWRGDVNPDQDRYVFPVLTAKLHLWELTNECDPQGCLVQKHHTIATLRFHGVEEDLRLVGFNHQNAIFGLTIERQERDNGPSPFCTAEFQASFGMGATFKCATVEVVDALACDADGNVLGG